MVEQRGRAFEATPKNLLAKLKNVGQEKSSYFAWGQRNAKISKLQKHVHNIISPPHNSFLIRLEFDSIHMLFMVAS